MSNFHFCVPHLTKQCLAQSRPSEKDKETYDCKRKLIQLNPQTVVQVTISWPQEPNKQLRDRVSTWILLGNPLCVPIICIPIISLLRSLKHLSHLKSKIPLLKVELGT